MKNLKLSRSAILFIATILSFWPVWVWYVRRMTDGSDEPLGVIALVAGGFLLWRNRDEISLSKRGVIGAASCLLLYSVGYGFLPPLIRAVLAVVTIACLSGQVTKRPGLWCVFLLSLPVVASLQFYLGYPMRLFSAMMADGILSMLGLDIMRQGTELVLNGETPVGVDPPCSGVRMLWMGAFLSAMVCALGGYRWFRTTLFMAGGCFAVVVANGLRVTMLFVKESGLLSMPDWTHEGIGVLVFLLLVFVLRKAADKADSAVSETLLHENWACPSFESRKVTFAFLLLCMLGGLFPFVSERAEADPVSSDVFPGWPEQWQRHFLEPVQLTESEKSFASSFPGKIGVFRAGHSKVIFRWVTRPTRLLHSSADCLRAEGYEIATERAGCFFAEDKGSGIRYWVEESIFNEDSSWGEVSTWFWSATFQRTEGPWWAVTTIKPVM